MSVSEAKGLTISKNKSDPEEGKGEIILEGKGICKVFPGVWEHLILDHIDIDVLVNGDRLVLSHVKRLFRVQMSTESDGLSPMEK